MFPILFIRHIDKQDKTFWQTCNIVRNDDVHKLKERLQEFPEHIQQKTANGITLLYFSKSKEMTSYLLKQGLSIDTVDEWGNTPLHLAAYEGFTEAISVYLQHGANTNAQNKWGQKPHQLALTPATCDAFVDEIQHTPNTLDEQLYHITLYDAAKQGKEAAVQYMLAAGVDPNRLNHEDFQADYWEQTPLYHAIFIGYHRIVRLLLQHGANPNVHAGVSLYRAAYNVATLQALHQYGAKATPEQLDQACWEAVVNVGNSAMVQELISYGAPLAKEYIIHDAIRRVDQTTDEYPKIVKALIQHRPELLDAISSIDETPLIKAVDMGNQLMVECLLELGADINKPNQANITPLMTAIRRGYTSLITYLIQRGADATSLDDMGFSPYSYAVLFQSQKMIDSLQSAIQDAGLPIPEVPLPPTSEAFQTNTNYLTHFFHDDDWNDAMFIRWDKDKFLTLAYQLGYINRYRTIYEIPIRQVKCFFQNKELTMEQMDKEDIMIATQYLAFHPDYPDTWMTYINWWNEDSDVDYTQMHFRCPEELLEKTRAIIEESDLIGSYTMENIAKDHPIEHLYAYGQKCLQMGLDELWQMPFYQPNKDS